MRWLLGRSRLKSERGLPFWEALLGAELDVRWPVVLQGRKLPDPFEALVRAVGSLNAQEQAAMRDALHHVLTTVAADGAHRHFGVCQDCAYLSGEMYRDSTRASRSALECLLFGLPIEPDDAGLLCAHYRPKSERREDGHRE
jgi:hypothetical protein